MAESEALLYIESDSKLGLQAQIRQKLVESIHLGIFKPGMRLPSSRKLAAHSRRSCPCGGCGAP